MNNKINILFVLILLFSMQSVFSQDEAALEEERQDVSSSSIVTAVGVEGYVRGSYDRSNLNRGEVSVIGSVELFDQLRFRGGFAYGQLTDHSDVNFFLHTRYSPFSHRFLMPLNFSLIYNYENLIGYETETHSIFPFVSYGTDRAGASIGMALRFVSFFGEPAIYESVFSFKVYCNFILTDTFVLGAAITSFTDFRIENMGALFYMLNARINLSDNLSIPLEFELRQSGLDGLSATYYGVSFRGGVVYTW